MQVTIKELTISGSFQALDTPASGYFKLSGKILNAAKNDWGSVAQVKLGTTANEHELFPDSEELYIALERPQSGQEMIRTSVSVKGTVGDVLQYTYYHD